MVTLGRQQITVAAVAILAALMVTFLSGLAVGRRTAPSTAEPAQAAAVAKGMHPEASARAIAFYKAYYRGQDHGAAWDMVLPGRFGDRYKTREEYVEFWSKRSPAMPDVPFEIQEFKRVDDYVYLISDADAQWLIWVTKRTGDWKVGRFMAYDGGEIEW